MDIEKVAVNTVALAISKSNYLVPNINSGDKEPSWDGDTEVYNKAGVNHNKSDLNIKIPVQVKGKLSDSPRKKTIKYPVEISDLRNYLQAGGTIYFVVYMDSSGENSQIYYADMLPFELKKILSKHGDQNTHNMSMKKLPKNKDDMTDVFLCFARDMKRQKAAIAIPSITIEDLARQGVLNEISFGYTTVSPQKAAPLNFLFKHGAYIYAKLPQGIEIPVDHFDKIDQAKTRISVPIKANGKTFYTDYEAVCKKNVVELHFGKSTILTFEYSGNKSRFDFSLNGTLSERIRDAEFIVEAVVTREFKVGDAGCSLNDLESETNSFDLPKLKSHLRWLKSVQQMMDILYVKKDLDFSNFTEMDKQNLLTLLTAVLDKQAVSLKNAENIFGVYTIANIKILLCAIESAEQKGMFNVYSLQDAPVVAKAKGDNGEEYLVSFYALLSKDAITQCCNIDFDVMLEQIQSIPLSQKYSEKLNQLLLQLLLAYDESNPPRGDVLSAALKLSEWLKNNDSFSEKEILALNYYQTVKRVRSLNELEVQELLHITENHPIREDFYVGAYILLENYTAAKIHFDKMPADLQEVFRSYPIFHLLETVK